MAVIECGMVSITPMHLYLTALPIFVAAIGVEALYYRSVLKQPYGWKVSGSNFLVALGFLATQALTKGLVLATYVFFYELRPMTIPLDRWESWLALFIGIDFLYYWMHRLSHEIRWMWVMHSVHHSASQITLSVAYRLGWTNIVAGMWLFMLPLCWLGFDPRAVLVLYTLNQLYQFWLHTETIPKLGVLEKFFNTPSHHRVHHATNPEYLDRNHGGVFIIWDRMFGTFAEEKDDVPRTYGLVHPLRTLNPIKIAFAEWGALIEDLRRDGHIRTVWGYLFGPPGWRPNGQGITSEVIRRRAVELAR